MRTPPSGRSPFDGSNPLFVTRPALPPLAALVPLLQEIWDSCRVTNGGPMQARFERALCAHLGVHEATVVANATLGLALALRHVGADGGEVITTPFSFVATGHAVLWAGATPVFADIEPRTLGLDPEAVARRITPRTRAIMAVHCYGYPCDVEGLERVAKAHGLPLVYDAAHAFGVRHRGRSVADYGDLSVLSFHATKVFNTFEGGAIVARDPAQKAALDRLVNYGIVDDLNVDTLGINAKASEFNAALGLVQLDYVRGYVAARRAVDARYRELLADCPAIRCLEPAEFEGHNFYNFPVLVEPGYGADRDSLHAHLKAHGVHARRYFHPLISEFAMYRHLPGAEPSQTPVARQMSAQVLCLPIFPGLEVLDQSAIVDLIRSVFARRAS